MTPLQLAILLGQKDEELDEVIQFLEATKRNNVLTANEEETLRLAQERKHDLGVQHERGP